MCSIPLFLGISMIGLFNPDQEVITEIIEKKKIVKWAYFLRLLVFLQVTRISTLMNQIEKKLL